MELSLEQKKALALAAARKRVAEQGGGQQVALMPNLSSFPGIGPLLGAIGYDGRVNTNASSVPALDPISTMGENLAESVPFVGGKLKELGQNVDAGFASMVEGKPVTAEQRGQVNAQNEAQFPGAQVAGEVAGAALPFAAIAKVPALAKAFGLVGPLWQRALYGAGSSAAVVFLDAVSRGEPIDQAAVKAGITAPIGAAAPLVERGVGTLINAVTRSGAPAEANVLASGLARDKIDPLSVSDALNRLGPDAVMADLGPNMTRQAGAIASLPGQGQTTVRDALLNRNAGTNTRIQGDVDAVLGPAPVPSQVRQEIKGAQKALSPQYETALESATAVDTTGIANNLDSLTVNERGQAQAVAKQIRDMLNITGETVLDPNPRTLLNTRHAIDGMFDADSPTSPMDGNVKRVLTDIRKQVDALLTEHVPGIKDVDAQFADLASQREGFEYGRTVLDVGKEAVPPIDLHDKAFTKSPFVFNRIIQGARADLERIIGTTANDLTALKTALKGDGSWNRQKLVELYGPDRADALLNVLERETTYQRTFDTVTRNSETAARNAAQKDVSPMQFGEHPPSATGLLLALPQKAANAAAKARSETVNARVAEALMSKAPPELVDQLLVAKALRDRRGYLPAPSVSLALLNNSGK